MKAENYLRYLNFSGLFASKRTREILSVNPTIVAERKEAENIAVTVFDYDPKNIDTHQYNAVEPVFHFRDSSTITWINIDEIRKADVDAICERYKVHSLLVEDILSVGQRPKMDEVEGVLYCLLYMLYFNDTKKTVETEQISLVMGENFVISFQEDSSRDVFTPLRNKLRITKSQQRQRTTDYLLYSMLDLIVDNYFLVMEQLGDQLENLEENVIRKSNLRTLAEINQQRKELIVLKRNLTPVRDLVSGILRSESDLLEDRTTKYFKDVHDHISQAVELSDNYRDMIMNLQDLYISNVNLRLNEVMKVMTIVTCVLAPATVIGGIFGMNFDVIPYAHQPTGFWFAIAAMFIIPVVMVVWFRRRGWF